jgi:hypothetical protein
VRGVQGRAYVVALIPRMQYGALAMQRIVRGRAGRKRVNRLRAIVKGVPQIQKVSKPLLELKSFGSKLHYICIHAVALGLTIYADVCIICTLASLTVTCVLLVYHTVALYTGVAWLFEQKEVYCIKEKQAT